jgi:predicted ATPase
VFNFNSNQWTYEPKAVQDFLDSRSRIDPDNVDANFLLQHIRDLPVGTQQVLAVAAAIGPVFDARLVYAFIEDHSIGVEESGGPIEQRISSSKMVTHSWVLGLQNAIVEGMIVAVSSLFCKVVRSLTLFAERQRSACVHS